MSAKRLSRAFAGSLVLLTASAVADNHKLAVIIDDLGYSVERGKRALALPGPLTVAVLPFTPHAETLAAMANDAEVDVIIHQPMQSLALGHNDAGTLTAEMSAEVFRASVGRALDAVPHAVGVSNHTGSLLTTHRGAMVWFMTEVDHRGLFFVDSRTTHHTVALEVAMDHGIPATKRDVFLDHVMDRTAMEQQFARALAIAKRQGHAVLIAHPHDASFEFLEQVLPLLADYDMQAVRVSTLTRKKAVL
jgi:polysaccharide deacetylase 2 family uncharacterized protein YibQ